MQAEATLDEIQSFSKVDVFFTTVNLASTAAALILPFFYYSKSAIIAFAIFYTITGLGLTAGYHRLFAHSSYHVPRWLERVIAICGYLAIQRGPIFWVAMHRLHHKYTDIPGKDPHTPLEGLWHVHFGWTHRRRRDVWDNSIYRKFASDLTGDRLYERMDYELTDYITYVCLMASSFLLGGWIGGPGFDVHNGICFFVWIGLLNRVALLHAFGFINSVCHLWGTRPFKTKKEDQSTNNLAVALMIFGEGWHNNHHAFPGSARQGLRWYQVDVAWYFIWFLKKVGLASRVRGVTRDAMRSKARGRVRLQSTGTT